MASQMMLVFTIFFFSAFLFADVSSMSVASRGPSEATCPNSDEIDDECLEDLSGFKSCQPDEETYRTFTIVKCSGSSTKCECQTGYLNALIEWKPQKCKCVDSSPHPSFPSTGHLKWTGFEALMERDWWEDRILDRKPRALVQGEAYKDSSGRFLLEYTKVKDWWGNGYGPHDPAELGKEIKIILPEDNGMFTKVTRSNDGKCNKESLYTNMESFDFLWEDGLKDIWFADYYRKVSEVPSGEPNIKTQRWGGNFTYADFMFYSYSAECNFFVDYDADKGVAVPKKFWKKIDASDGADIKVTNLEYKYQPLHGNMKEIKLEDYCDGDYVIVDPNDIESQKYPTDSFDNYFR